VFYGDDDDNDDGDVNDLRFGHVLNLEIALIIYYQIIQSTHKKHRK